MTTPLQLRSLVSPEEVLVAGVPWPRYKVLALITGFAALLLVGVVTTRATPSVLTATGVALCVGLVLRALQQHRQ
ncbi:MAG TPA: hypothetical protein VFA16_13410 [Mycobacterium sp.]|uniref:hypothetical protein n=1 Tax=Mycobacterium sp. TaxID=1785 RepID=UPI002D2C4668|nr:hypothetical protein [Mycobacterium sp.]HZU48230.1 hypothetical protein [Mycobacterium sp.]